MLSNRQLLQLKKAVPICTDEPRPDDDCGVDRDGKEDPVSGSLRDYNDSDEQNSGVQVY